MYSIYRKALLGKEELMRLNPKLFILGLAHADLAGIGYPSGVEI
jgi:hypothetical protein